jgi:NADPH-dependent curcumin reductase CurA
LAKRQGLRVIGSAGSQEKLDFLKNELGYDVVFNYKTQDKRAALTEAVGKEGLDIYYDLVGDDTVEIALDLLNYGGRILYVGILAGHHNQEPAPPKNLYRILMKKLRYEGYIVFDRYQHLGEFWKEITPLVAQGEIKFKEVIVKAGVESLPENYIKLLNGAFTGKVNVQVADL